jgi:hypothetical protein
MPWVKLDDQFFTHPKVLDRTKDAKLLYMAGLTYAAANLTDGYLSPAALRLSAATVDVPTAVASELVEAGLWTVSRGGHQIHDYLEYNPSAEEVKAQRADNARRQAEWRERNKANPSTNEGGNAVSNSVTNAVSNTRPVPVPTPVPSPVTEPIPNEAPVADAPSRVRVKDDLFEAVAEACYGWPAVEITDTERKRANQALPELRRINATRADVMARAAAYRARSPDLPLTPQTLTKAWSDLGARAVKGNGVAKTVDISPIDELARERGTGRYSNAARR